MSQLQFAPASGLPGIVEALLFATDEPLTLQQLSDIIASLPEEGRPGRVTGDRLVTTIEELNRSYEETHRAFRIVKVAGGYQFGTRPEYGVWLGAMLREKAKRKLSVPALESLAVIAYKQPVTKPELEAIRGVNADYIMRSLLERNLITIVGRAATPGRPLLYGTTREFLKHFGLNDLADLPKPREIDELMAEGQFDMEKEILKELEAKRSGSGPADESSAGEETPEERRRLFDLDQDESPETPDDEDGRTA